MTLTNDQNSEEELIYRFETDKWNFDPSTRKSQKFAL